MKKKIVQETGLESWAVYDSPTDYPDRIVVRRFVGLVADKTPLYIGTDIEAARKSIPAGRINVGRMKKDKPALKEVWI